MRYRVACDVGGTFTDVVISDENGQLRIGKAPTVPADLFAGLRDAVADAVIGLGLGVEQLFNSTDLFVYSTTQATNAILEGATAKTALLVTEGFPDILVRREGGRLDPFNFAKENPAPYIPRHLTFEIRERIDSEGGVYTPIDIGQSTQTLRTLARREVEAVAVSFLWSTANPEHELRMRALIERALPGIPYTLSHEINPIIREYRRTSSAAIDASLKPLMQHHLEQVESGLREGGLVGELVAATSFGGVMHMDDLIRRPIYAVKSGPALAPVAGRAYAREETGASDIIVCDAGGTSFDVSLVRRGQVVFTRETWLGEQYVGHLTGLSSVDARSIGAGGGSIAWIDSGGLLQVGPQSAGADPGPACYGRGGPYCTVTDAAAVLGYIDPEYFLGGRMPLDLSAARSAIREIGERIGQSEVATAYGIMVIANERMVGAIREITVDQGVDPRESLLVAGGGAAGLNMVPIARELGCRRILIPRTASAFSACGAHHSDVIAEFSASHITDSNSFDVEGVNQTLTALERQMDDFADGLRRRRLGTFRKEFFVEARYSQQAWELEVPLRVARITSPTHVEAIVADFHEAHHRVYAVTDPGQTVECIYWKGRLTGILDKPPMGPPIALPEPEPRPRTAYFPETGASEVPAFLGAALRPGDPVYGPAIIEEATTTVVLYPGSTAWATESGNYLIEVAG